MTDSRDDTFNYCDVISIETRFA